MLDALEHTSPATSLPSITAVNVYEAAMNTEIGRELLVQDLQPPVVVVTGKDKSPMRATMWVAELTPTHVVLFAGDVSVTLILAINPDGTLKDDTGEQVHIWEYLGEV